MNNVKHFFVRYKHGLWAVSYLIIYLTWFCYLEQTVTRHYRVIHVPLDDYIPFCELFIIPYYLWFAYVAVSVLLVMFTDKDEYYKACTFLFTGMTVFLLVSTLWPNGQHLRPFTMPRDNILTQLVAGLYQTDTPTNIWPSIHVYNSLGAHIAIVKCKKLNGKRWIHISSLVLAISIILSTVFLKQHSVFDMLTAFVMALIMYVLTYRFDLVLLAKHALQTRRKSDPQVEYNR